MLRITCEQDGLLLRLSGLKLSHVRGVLVLPHARQVCVVFRPIGGASGGELWYVRGAVESKTRVVSAVTSVAGCRPA